MGHSRGLILVTGFSAMKISSKKSELYYWYNLINIKKTILAKYSESADLHQGNRVTDTIQTFTLEGLH